MCRQVSFTYPPQNTFTGSRVISCFQTGCRTEGRTDVANSIGSFTYAPKRRVGFVYARTYIHTPSEPHNASHRWWARTKTRRSLSWLLDRSRLNRTPSRPDPYAFRITDHHQDQKKIYEMTVAFVVRRNVYVISHNLVPKSGSHTTWLELQWLFCLGALVNYASLSAQSAEMMTYDL